MQTLINNRGFNDKQLLEMYMFSIRSLTQTLINLKKHLV